MSTNDTFEIVKWASKQADKYNIGVTGIVDAFIEANKSLGDVNNAKKFVEHELMSLKTK